MSDGLKTGLIVVGVGVAAYLVLSRSSAAASLLPPAAGPGGQVSAAIGAGSALATAPGVAPAPTAAPPSSGGSRSTISTIGHFAAVAAIAPIVLPTKIAITGIKDVGKATESTFKSIGSAIGSIF